MSFLRRRRRSRITALFCVLLTLNINYWSGCGQGLINGEGAIRVILTPDHDITQALQATEFAGAIALDVYPTSRAFRLVFPEGDTRSLSGRFADGGIGEELAGFDFSHHDRSATMDINPPTKQVTKITSPGGHEWRPTKILSAREIPETDDGVAAYVAANQELIEAVELAQMKDASGAQLDPGLLGLLAVLWLMCPHCVSFVIMFVVMESIRLAIVLVMLNLVGGLLPGSDGNDGGDGGDNGDNGDDGGQLPGGSPAPPIARDDAATTDEDVPVVIPVLLNDTDADGPLDAATLSVVTPPGNGSAMIDPLGGTVTYSPRADFNGTDSLVYQICDLDPTQQCAVAVATIVVLPVNDPPQAHPDDDMLLEDGVPDTATGNVLANDTDIDAGDMLFVVSVDGAAANVGAMIPGVFGTMTIGVDGAFTYVLNNASALVQGLGEGQQVIESFTYTASDGTDATQSAVTITIKGTNDAPVAGDDSAKLSEDSVPDTASGDVLGNDSDADASDSISVVEVNGSGANVGMAINGAFGVLQLDADGGFTYTLDNSNPTVDALNEGDSLTDTFTYGVGDGMVTTIASLEITINGANDPPTADVDTNAITEDADPDNVSGNVLSNDGDVDGPSPLSVTEVNGDSGGVGMDVGGLFGMIALNADGSYTYTLDNSNAMVDALNVGDTLTDTFTYAIGDGLATAGGTVEITINGANDPPAAMDDSYDITNGMTLMIDAAAGVLSNDSDVDDAAITAVLAAGPSQATTFTLNPDGSFTYEHDGSGPGTDSFTYRASDGVDTSEIATVTINIVMSPAANDDGYETTINTPLVVSAADGVIEAGAPGAMMDTGSPAPVVTMYGPVGGPLTTAPGSAFTTVGGGMVTFDADGLGGFTYDPASGFSGTDQFDYEITNSAGSDTATVTISVNEPPDAVDDDPKGVPAYVVNSGSTLVVFNGVGDIVERNDDVGFPAATLTSFGGGDLGGSVADHAAGTTISPIPSFNNGSLTVNDAGSLSFTPPTSPTVFLGTFTFDYQLQNAVGSDTATVTIDVRVAPTAIDDLPKGEPGYTTDVGVDLNQDALGGLLSNDDLGAPPAPLTSFGGGDAGGDVTSNAAGASVALAGGTLTVSASGSFDLIGPTTAGDFSFDYRIANVAGASDATVTIRVQQAPDAVDDDPGGAAAFMTTPDTSLSVPDGPGDIVERNDDLGFPAASLVSYGGGSVGGAAGDHAAGTTVSPIPTFNDGSLTVNADGSFDFTPPTDPAPFSGDFTFDYVLENVVGSDSATVTIDVAVMELPAAQDDNFTATGNVPIEHAAPGVLGDNGNGADTGTGIAVSSVQGGGANVGAPTATTAMGLGGVTGFVTLNADGGFVYEPPPGFEGQDTFTYEIEDASMQTSTASVTIVVGDVIWFIESQGQRGGGTGTFSDPFTSIADFNAAQDAGMPNAKPGDAVFLNTGTGDYPDGIVLQDDQRLFGRGVRLDTVFTADAASTAGYQGFAATAPGARPVIAPAAANGVTLAMNNTVRGLDVGNTPGGFGLANADTESVGTLTIADVSVTGTGACFRADSGGTLDVTFDSLSTSSASTAAVVLTNVVGGSFTVAGDGATAGSGGTISGTTGNGIAVTNCSGVVSLSFMTIQNFGTNGINVDNDGGGGATDLDVVLDDVVLDGQSVAGSVGILANTDAQGILDLVITDSVLQNLQSRGIFLNDIQGTGTSRLKIDNTTLDHGAALNRAVEALTAGNAVLEVRLENNSSFSSAKGVDSVFLRATGSSAMTALVSGCGFTTGRAGVFADAQDSATLNVTAANNTQTGTSTDGLFFLESDVMTSTVCADLSGNTSSSTPSITVRAVAADSTFGLDGFAGGDAAAAETFIETNNPAIADAAATGAGTFVAGGDCPQPGAF